MSTDAIVESGKSDFDRAVLDALTALPGAKFTVEPARGMTGVLALAPLTTEGEVFLMLGAQFDQGTLIADEVHNQQYIFPLTPTPLAFRASGTPKALVHELDRWVDEIIARGAFVDEWLHRDRVFATVTRLVGYGDTTMSFNESLAPRGLKLRLLLTGSFQGRGWINPRGIGAPTRSRRIRVMCWGDEEGDNE